MEKPITNDLVIKSNALIDASFKLTLAEFRLLNIVFAEISDSPDGSDGFYFNEFKVSAEKYSQVYDVDISTAYEALQDASKRLFHRYFTYEGLVFKKPDFVEVVESRWVSKIKYSKQGGYVKLVLTDDVKSMVGVLQKCFTQYHLQHTVGLTSTYAKRLYEIMIRWRNAGSKTPKISINELRNKLGVDENQYKLMADFKKRVLDIAIEQINEHTDIKAEYEQIKEGRSIVGFVFKFKNKKVVEGKAKVIERDPNTADMFTQLTDKQLARIVHSKKFINDYNGLVSAQNPANQSSGAWVAHMVEWLKKDPNNFTKRPIQEYLDDEQAQRF